MNKTPPVNDWKTDYDIFDHSYVKDPVPVWNKLRQECPIAHSDRWGGSWMPTKYADMQALVRMVPDLSSKEPLVVPPQELDPESEYAEVAAPPITSDPPTQIPIRRMILPFLHPKPWPDTGQIP